LNLTEQRKRSPGHVPSSNASPATRARSVHSSVCDGPFQGSRGNEFMCTKSSATPTIQKERERAGEREEGDERGQLNDGRDRATRRNDGWMETTATRGDETVLDEAKRGEKNEIKGLGRDWGMANSARAGKTSVGRAGDTGEFLNEGPGTYDRTSPEQAGTWAAVAFSSLTFPSPSLFSFSLSPHFPFENYRTSVSSRTPVPRIYPCSRPRRTRALSSFRTSRSLSFGIATRLSPQSSVLELTACPSKGPRPSNTITNLSVTRNGIALTTHN